MKKIRFNQHYPILRSVFLILFISLFMFGCKQQSVKHNTQNQPLFTGSKWFYWFYPWETQKALELGYYPPSEQEININPQQEGQLYPNPLDNNQTNDESGNDNQPTSPVTKTILTPPKPTLPNAIIHASLTSSPGSVAISGNSYQIQVSINGQPMKDGPFSASAGSSFMIQAEGKNLKKTFQVTSPSFGTNMIIQSLTLSINPLLNTATISGKLYLDLPGKMSGTLVNLTNGSATSCYVRNGYFSTSVILSNGQNRLTAIGKWLTVTIELPSISVLVQ